jgi:hypothetical protein
MKKLPAILMFAATCGLAQATTINAPSGLTGLNALSGESAYTWGVGINLGADETIDSASLTFSNIKLTAANSSGTGFLYSDLINAALTGVHTFTDNDAPGDYFNTVVSSGNIANLGKQFFASVGTQLSWTITFDANELAALNTFAADGIVDFGFDPDCHYNVGNICFTYTTRTSHSRVPDAPMTAYLLGISLLGMELFRRQAVSRRVPAKI